MYVAAIACATKGKGNGNINLIHQQLLLRLHHSNPTRSHADHPTEVKVKDVSTLKIRTIIPA